MFSRDLTLAKFDADLFAAMEQEAQRQAISSSIVKPSIAAGVQ